MKLSLTFSIIRPHTLRMEQLEPDCNWLSIPISEPFFRHRYRYHTLLNDSSTRIINLDPLRPEQPDTPPQCSLFNADLSRLGICLALAICGASPSQQSKFISMTTFCPLRATCMLLCFNYGHSGMALATFRWMLSASTKKT